LQSNAFNAINIVNANVTSEHCYITLNAIGLKKDLKILRSKAQLALFLVGAIKAKQ